MVVGVGVELAPLAGLTPCRLKGQENWIVGTLSYLNPHRTSLGMLQLYHLPDSPPNCTNTRTVPTGMSNPGSQPTAVENNPSVERFGSGEEFKTWLRRL